MADITQFEDLIAWQKARKLCQLLDPVTNRAPFDRDFRFKAQIESSSGSVMDNIAEGFDRGGNREFRQYLCIARASCAETRSQLYRAADKRYISQLEFEELKKIALETSRLIAGLINYINRSQMKGHKFR